MTTVTLTLAAARYAAKGWPIFPVKPQSKEPLTLDGFKSATTDPTTVARWWATWPDANIGFVPGRAGFVVFDLDGPEAPVEARALGLLAEPTRTVVTPKGLHLYYQHPGGHIGNRKLAEHIDVRADDGYVLLPPSIHPSGVSYRGEPRDAIAPPPAALAALSNGNGRKPAAGPLPDRIAEGQRNTLLTSAAGSMRSRGLSETAILAALVEENATRCVPPLPEDEVRAIAASVGRYAPAPQTAAAPVPTTFSWDRAQSAPAFLEAPEETRDFLEEKLVARGAITELFSPRGLGKTHIGHAVAVRLARSGLRVLLLDRDNSPREVRRRLRGWDAASAPSLEVLTRDQAPPLTDLRAWAAFPVEKYDVVMIDSLDSASEGVGEQDSSRPSRALAAILDIVRRPDGPGVLVLGNTVKSAAHSRGSGVVEDRADIVYEVRDATDLRPSGSKPWWQELPPAGADAWAERAARRKKRAKYRLALVPSKFRVGEEPDPFVLELDLGGEPWTLRDVTDALTQEGEQARAAAVEATQAQRSAAAAALRAAIERGATLNRTEAVEFLTDHHDLTKRDARALLTEREGRDWRTEVRTDLHGHPHVLAPAGGVVEPVAERAPRDSADGVRAPDGAFRPPSDTKGGLKAPPIVQELQGFPNGALQATLSNDPPPATAQDLAALFDLDPDEVARQAQREDGA